MDFSRLSFSREFAQAFVIASFAVLLPGVACGNNLVSAGLGDGYPDFKVNEPQAVYGAAVFPGKGKSGDVYLKSVPMKNSSAEQERGKGKLKAKKAVLNASGEKALAGDAEEKAISKPRGKKPNKKQRKARGEGARLHVESKKTPTGDAKKSSNESEQYFAGVELPKDYKNISIFGRAVATKAQAAKLIRQNNPSVRLSCSVEELVDIYWEEAERENVRPDLALAQSIIETGSYSYGGDVSHNQNNFCGLGTTGNGVKGAAFKTPRLGVRAHIQHLLAYTRKNKPSTSVVDPRYDLAHRIRLERGLVSTWYGLNGTWAMGSQYCERIMAVYQKMLMQKG